MNRNTNKFRAPGVNSPRGPGPSASAWDKPKSHVNHPLCRTSNYKPPGSNQVGLAKDNQPSKVVWELDYGLSETKFKQLSTRFPGIAFVQTGFDSHDHPIAHTSYRIVWENVLRKLNPGAKVADIAGNPAHNERFNSRQVKRDRPIAIDTFCKVLCPKDSIRKKTRWGPPIVEGKVRWEEMTVYDMYRNDENKARFAGYDTFLMNHVIYYYTFAEVNKLLNLNQNSVLIATLHKLEGQNGTINCGEQSYEKDFVTGSVVQKNVETGEEYSHPDPAPWFRNFSYADENGAMAWTVNKGCDDTYVLTITSTDTKLVPESCWLGGRIIFRNETEVVEVTISEAEGPPPAYAVEEVKFHTHDLIPGYHVNKEKIIKITHPELYNSLKNFMINKPRNARTLQDLTAKAHREAGNNTLLGNNNRIKISSEALTEHIAAAWVQGVGLESDVFQAAIGSAVMVADVNRNLSGRSLHIGPGNVTKQAARFALALNHIVRSREPVSQVLQQLDELL